MRYAPSCCVAALLFAVVQVLPVSGQSQKPTLKPAEYGRFETAGFGQISSNGQWLAVPVNRVNEENELRILQTGSDSAVVVPYGTQAAFSSDGRWAAYSIGISEKEREAAEKAETPVHSKVGLLDLGTGMVTKLDDLASFAFSGDGRYIAMKGYAAKDQKHEGVDLIVRDLTTGVNTTFGNVAEFAWTDEGALLAFTIGAETKAGNGLKTYDPETGVLKTLESDTAAYKGLTWREDADDLAVFRVRTEEEWEGDTHVIVHWSGLSGKTPERHEFDPNSVSGFPSATRIVDFRELTWTADGKYVLFGVQDRVAKEKPDSTKDGEEVEKPGVEIWHAKDVDILPEQKVRAQRDREENHLTAWDPEANRFIEIGNELTESATAARAGNFALALDQTPYERERMFGPVFNDVYVVDLDTGERTRVKDRVEQLSGGLPQLSPTGRYVLYVESDHYWVYDVVKKTHTNITRNVQTSFMDVEDDHTVAQKPPHGVAGWTPEDRAVLLYDKYDVWEITPDEAKATRLTNGAADEVRHRIVRIDNDEVFIDPSQPTYVALYGERTKEYGYGRMQRGKAVTRDLLKPASVTRLTKAEEADVYAYMTGSYSDAPDYFAGGPALANAHQVTDLNPFQAEYAWGRTELVDFTNRQGVPLQASLHYPANHEPGRKYPMIVLIYEIRSNAIHQYYAPSERNAYNPTNWTQEGYFVLQPDIVYRDRDPGLSALDAIEPAVDRMIATGMIDEARIGLVGHSWGGYQTAFVSTVSNKFAAGVAGAPLTELASMYLSVYWNSGGTDARIFEISQGRMEVPPWEDLDAYTRNSAVWNIEKMETPLLVTFGDKDGAVDWHQGIVMYNAARRENKDLVMLVYEGENHGLAKKPNQIDYQRRVMEWFNHYLKGDAAPAWIQSGVRFLDKDKELKRVTTSTSNATGNDGAGSGRR
ncbi:MAG: alpha/beta hydrolase family protein [Longimicrobiales bacterium]